MNPVAGAPEVAVGRGFLEDRPAQVEVLDDALGGQREGARESALRAAGHLPRRPVPISVDMHRDRIRDADGISELYHQPIG